MSIMDERNITRHIVFVVRRHAHAMFFINHTIKKKTKTITRIYLNTHTYMYTYEHI